MVAISSFCFANFFSNSTLYLSGSMGTPYINGEQVLEDDYNYTLGIRKIALFDYQSRSRFYKGSEKQLSDKAIVGAVNGWEYLFSMSSVRNQGHEYTDSEVWLKWSNNWFVTKAKYIDKGSRDLQIFDYDARFRLNFNKIDVTIGGAVRGHPVYGHPAYEDYEGYWWDLAYEYGYTDYYVPIIDLNESGTIDDYWLWIETDPDTEEGYWTYYYEEADYYWEDPDSNAVAHSDAEFYEYHMPGIIKQYNEDNKEKEWQAEASVVIGFDLLLGTEKFYSHTWVNLFPYSVGLTDKAYEGDEMQYDLGLQLGTQLSEHIGVFIEGIKSSNYNREEYKVTTGLNWRF
tara:strand:+ start:3592 stop:4620 length:1029 start_codon:yes stop_codon:yes gene_type:complete